MKKLRFIFYYLKLRLSVACGLHQTCNPLDLKWRWKHWKYKAEQQKRPLQRLI